MNDGSGILAMIKEDMHQLSDQTDKGKSNDGHNFVHIFPPELSNKLFSYLSDRDLFTCSRCCISWRQVINDNSQWYIWQIKLSTIHIIFHFMNL